MNTIIEYINYYNNTKIRLVLCEQNWTYLSVLPLRVMVAVFSCG